MTSFRVRVLIFGLAIGLTVGGLFYLSARDVDSVFPEGHKILDQLESSGAIDFTLPDLEGRSIRLSDQINKGTVILSFWATWCAPCVQEMPSMLNLVQKVPNVHVVAVSADGDRAAVEAFVKAFGANRLDRFTILMDPDQKIARQYGTQVLPESFVFKKGGQLVRKVAGSERWDHPQAIEFFEALSK